MKKQKKDCFENAISNQNEKNVELTRSFYKNNLYKDEVDVNDVLKYFNSLKEYRSFYKNQMVVLNNKSIKYGITKDALIKKIKTDDCILREVTPDAKRQRIHEKTQEETLKQAIKKVKQKHKDCKISYENNLHNYKYVITDKGFIRESDFRDSYHESKSFDFIINIQKNDKYYRLFFVNKYTNESGGIQDDVCREVENTHKYCKLNVNPLHKFVFVLDGNYWTNKAEKIITSENVIRTTSSKLYRSLLNLVNQL